jgi:hypothetical protein
MSALLNRLMMFLIPLLLLVACGGGGGSSMTGTSTASPQNSLSTGAISGFGSVIVNGVHWSDDSSVQITLDDDPGTKNDLRVGMVVEVEGDDNGNGTGQARKIRFENIVRGPVDSVDAAGGTLVVLGQPVKVMSGATVFDNVADLASIKAGDIVAVSGWFENFDPTLPNNIDARRIEKEPAPFSGVLKVKGFVKSLDSAGRTFKINDLVVDFSTAQFPNGSAGNLKNGLFVDVRTHAPPVPLAGTSGGRLAAETVKIKEARPSPTEGAQVEVEGIIADFNAVAKTFTVGGIPVNAHAIDVSGLANGMKIELKGTFVNGVLVVSANAEVEREMQAHVKIEALVQAVDRTGGTITLLGRTVKVTAMTQFIDETPAALRTFGLKDIVAMSDAVRVRAFEDRGGNLVAVKVIRLRPPLQQVVLQGRMDSKDLPTTSLTILGIKVQGGPGTQWRNNTGPVDANTWFATTALNTVVRAAGVTGTDGKSVDVTGGQVQTGEDDD